jgi:cysteine desulfuration protein SufE
MAYPPPIDELVENLSFLDRTERIQTLIDIGKSFRDPGISKPYPAENRVPGCESDVYSWVTLTTEQTLSIQIAVDNPQGLSAMALAALLIQALHNQPPQTAETLSDDLVAALFGPELSMGKSLGLTNLVRQVRAQSLNLA